MSRRASMYQMRPVLDAVAAQEGERSRRWLAERLGLMPRHWSRWLAAEHGRRGGLERAEANRWLLELTDTGRGKVPLAASDGDLRAAAKEAAAEAAGIVADLTAGTSSRNGAAVLALLAQLCGRWGVPALAVKCGEEGPAVRRYCCSRWWLRRLRRAHAKRSEGAAIVGGVVRRGLWPYCSQDGVDRRGDQRRRNALALARAEIEDAATGECLSLVDVVSGSIANPENKRSELMVRIKGHDSVASLFGWGAEFWTLTAPSRFHAQRILGATAEPNPEFGELQKDGKTRSPLTPKDAQTYISKVWARARAAWKRRGLEVAGLRTAEPHHDGTPHWHLVVYGPRRDLRHARRLLRVYALRDTPDEPGARRHRFDYKVAEGGSAGAKYAAKYVAKNINGAGMEGERDAETGRKVSASVLRVDAWAAAWGIRQFQFFGGPLVSIWRALRKMREPVGRDGEPLEEARKAADAPDWAGFWLACRRGGLRLAWRDDGRLTAYGDAAPPKVAGVVEGARRAMLAVRQWVIHWAGRGKEAAGFAFPRSCVNNCTGDDFDLPDVFGCQQFVDMRAAAGG